MDVRARRCRLEPARQTRTPDSLGPGSGAHAALRQPPHCGWSETRLRPFHHACGIAAEYIRRRRRFPTLRSRRLIAGRPDTCRCIVVATGPGACLKQPLAGPRCSPLSPHSSSPRITPWPGCVFFPAPAPFSLLLIRRGRSASFTSGTHTTHRRCVCASRNGSPRSRP